MKDIEFWEKKINALLHDPPQKCFNIKAHENQANQLATSLGIKLDKHDFKEADWIASAADRLNFPSYKSIGGANFSQKPYLTHPLSGVRLNLGLGTLLPSEINHQEIISAIQKSLHSIPAEIKGDAKKLYLWLWRNWSTEIKKIPGSQLGFLWNLLPADTRIPDHSIWTHQNLTSAIAATKSDKYDPAFLLFTIGPVQSFISAARRTQDLWMGSYLLSYLNWSAIKVIAEEIGPDAIIFPNLKGQPLCDLWLHEQGILNQRPKTEDLYLPSLPNRFLAIVPSSQGSELAKKADENMRSQWQKITTAVREALEDKLEKKRLEWSATWEKQTGNLFETYWQVYPWRPTGEEPLQSREYQKFFEPHKPFLGDRYDKTTKILEVYARGGGQYMPNLGSIYSDLYYITEKALGSRKVLRNFSQVDETGEKSTLGGDRAVVYDGVDRQIYLTDSSDRKGRQQIRKFWQLLADKLSSNDIQPNGKERLDAVELTKRLAWRFYLQKELSLNSDSNDLSFPSTHTVATASFKKAVLEIVQKPEVKLLPLLQDWVESVFKNYDLIKLHSSHKSVISYLAKNINFEDQLLKKFLQLDGRLLFEEFYTPENDDLPSSVTQEQRREIKKKIKIFLEACKNYNLPSPRRYYAIIMMDGDEMGKWLSGDKMPNYQEVLHPDIFAELQKLENWQEILKTPRLMSPAIHGFISQALSDFSLKLVRHIVEKRYPGKLVYAGGDDVLALVPVEDVLKIALELRAAFSGEIKTDGQSNIFEVKFAEQKTGYIWLESDEDKQLLTTMGYKATASVGIVITHVTTPLDIVLEEVRKAEKQAKNHEGRDAFSITFLKRAGEIMTAGAKWTYKNQSNKFISTMELLVKYQQFFAHEIISTNFAYILRKQAKALSNININAQQSEIKRLLLRQQPVNKIAETDLKKLAEELSELSHLGNKKLENFADLLVLTTFLATGTGED